MLALTVVRCAVYQISTWRTRTNGHRGPKPLGPAAGLMNRQEPTTDGRGLQESTYRWTGQHGLCYQIALTSAGGAALAWTELEQVESGDYWEPALFFRKLKIF